MKLTKLAPLDELCLVGACPAVFRTESGSLVIVGKSVDSAELPEGQVGADEFVIEISKELVQAALAADE